MAIKVTKIRGVRSSSSTHILLLADCFKDNVTDRSSYESAATTVCTAIADASWFPQSADKVCLWRADSYLDSNHTKPLGFKGACQATGTIPMTRFGTSYDDIAGDCRYLQGSSTKVSSLIKKLRNADSTLPTFARRIVLVNYPTFGGMGSGNTAWVAAGHPNLGNLALHELGHAFGLHDEYESSDGVADRALTEEESNELLLDVNLTSDPHEPLWKDPAGPAFHVYPKNPGGCSAHYTPGPPNKLDSFQGGGYWHCRYYRPELSCKMRHIDDEYCSVCRQMIAWFLDSTKSLPIY